MDKFLDKLRNKQNLSFEESINALLHDFLNKDGGMIYFNAAMSSQDQGDLSKCAVKHLPLGG